MKCKHDNLGNSQSIYLDVCHKCCSLLEVFCTCDEPLIKNCGDMFLFFPLNNGKNICLKCNKEYK